MGPQQCDPSHVPCVAPVRCQLPATCQGHVLAFYCGSMAIDFSCCVNLDGLGLCSVFVHVWLHGRSISPPLAKPLCKLKDTQKAL